MSIRPTSPAGVAQRFADATGSKLHSPLEKAIAVLCGLHVASAKAGSNRADAETNLRKETRNSLQRDIGKSYDHFANGGSLEDLDLGPDPIEVAKNAIESAKRVEHVLAKSIVAAERFVLDRLRDPKAKLIERCVAA